jgi:hypothetical protein
MSAEHCDSSKTGTAYLAFSTTFHVVDRPLGNRPALARGYELEELCTCTLLQRTNLSFQNHVLPYRRTLSPSF